MSKAMSKSMQFDELYVEVILGLSDREVMSLPYKASIEYLAQHFPETYASCVETVKLRNASKTPPGSGFSPAEIDEK